MLHITDIMILKSDGADELYITTDLPSGEYPFNGFAAVKMRLAKGTAEDYCRMHFADVPVKNF